MSFIAPTTARPAIAGPLLTFRLPLGKDEEANDYFTIFMLANGDVFVTTLAEGLRIAHYELGDTPFAIHTAVDGIFAFDPASSGIAATSVMQQPPFPDYLISPAAPVGALPYSLATHPAIQFVFSEPFIISRVQSGYFEVQKMYPNSKVAMRVTLEPGLAVQFVFQHQELPARNPYFRCHKLFPFFHRHQPGTTAIGRKPGKAKTFKAVTVGRIESMSAREWADYTEEGHALF